MQQRFGLLWPQSLNKTRIGPAHGKQRVVSPGSEKEILTVRSDFQADVVGWETCSHPVILGFAASVALIRFRAAPH